MMKYSVLILTMLAAMAMLPVAAFAAAEEGNRFRPYVGTDYQYNHLVDEKSSGVNASDVIKNNLSGAAIHAGARIHKNWGVELGYERTEDGTKNNVLGSGINTKIREQGATADLLGYYPVAGGVELIGTVGFGVIDTRVSDTAGFSGSSTHFKSRIGGGAQYWLTDKVNLRGLVRYEGEDFDRSPHNSIIGSAGVNFEF